MKSCDKSKKTCVLCGQADALLASLDKCGLYYPQELLKVRAIQKVISNIVSEATGFGKNVVQLEDIELLLAWISTDVTEDINQFQRFTNLVSIEFNEARIRCRALELSLVDIKANKNTLEYINRLSTLFFYMALKVEK